jgi:hypothetical protein
VKTSGIQGIRTATQANLGITPGLKEDEPTITVDKLEIAQFIYLLISNEQIREVIDTITSKVVLILGRFTEDRKIILDSLREELRRKDYVLGLFAVNWLHNVTRAVIGIAGLDVY